MKTIEPSELVSVTGGMRLDDMRLSTNIEDRRPKWAIERDDAWFRAQAAREPQSSGTQVPLPPRRPPGL